MSAGLEQLRACVELVMADFLKQVRREMTSVAAVDASRPMTAVELCERWKITAAEPGMQLQYLSRRCRAWGLRPMAKTEGWGALYLPAEVQRAEAFAGGQLRSRQHAARKRETRQRQRKEKQL